MSRLMHPIDKFIFLIGVGRDNESSDKTFLPKYCSTEKKRTW